VPGVLAALWLALTPAAPAQDEEPEGETGAPKPRTWEELVRQRASERFPAGFLLDPANIAAGRNVFFKRCTYCHVPAGHAGGFAPQLRPNLLTADFIFDRVTNGFRLMPPWGDMLSEEERRAVVAYVLSDPRAF
jgi:mono/diheme cytochrome c family protein